MDRTYCFSFCEHNCASKYVYFNLKSRFCWFPLVRLCQPIEPTKVTRISPYIWQYIKLKNIPERTVVLSLYSYATFSPLWGITWSHAEWRMCGDQESMEKILLKLIDLGPVDTNIDILIWNIFLKQSSSTVKT